MQQSKRTQDLDSRNPSDPWLMMPATIKEIVSETPGVATYKIALQNEFAETYSIKAGQFNMLYVPGVGESAISLSGDAMHCDPLVHTIRAVGNVTRELAKAGVGSTLGVRGPFGSYWPLEQCLNKDLILVAGGIGLAPLRPVVYEVMANRDRYRNVSLLVGARSPADLLYAEQYDEFRDAQIDVHTTVDRASNNWNGDIGFVTLLLERLTIERPEETVLFTCGPEVMMTYIVRTALVRGLLETANWLSLERNMNCAIGHCGHCQLGPHFLCMDGPVFRYDHVASLMAVEAL